MKPMNTLNAKASYAALLALVTATSAMAQSDGEPSAAPSALPQVRDACQVGQVEGGTEMVAKADAVVERLKSATSAIQRQLDVARSQRDVVKVLFLSEKLSQANASLRSAVERRASLKSAVERGDSASAKQDSEVIAIMGERGDEYLNATSQAVGEGTRVQEEASVKISTDVGTPSTSQTSEYPAVDPLTGAADSTGRQSSGQTASPAGSPASSDPPLANQNTIPSAPVITVSTSA